MNSQGDSSDRFATASRSGGRKNSPPDERGRGFAFSGKIRRGVDWLRGWSGRHLPGGEVTLWVGLGVVLIVLFAMAVTNRSNIGLFRGGPMNEPQPVGVAKAVKGDIDVTLSALGTVTPLATATVTPQVSGQIVRIDFREGQMVRAGDSLAVVDPRSYQAALDEAKGQLAKDRAALANAEAEFKRQRALFAAHATSQQDLDSAEAAAKQDKGAIEADKASVESAAIKLGFTRLVSPISGRVGLRGVDLGNYVSAGQSTGVAVVTQVDPISVLFSIPEDSIGDVLTRMRETGGLPVAVYDRSMSRKLAEGRLVATDSQISTTTGTVKMRALFDNENSALFPNQFVNVKVLVETQRGKIVVPVTAIQRGSQGTYVFVVKADHTVTMRAVTLGAQDADRVVVSRGLNVGEMVVTDGADRLSDGSPVSVPSGQKVESVAPAEGARVLQMRSNDRRALFRKLTPEERESLHAMKPEERKAWLKAHRDELMKRKNQPMPPGRPGGPPPP